MAAKGKWAQGIEPRHFSWIIKDQLAICERPVTAERGEISLHPANAGRGAPGEMIFVRRQYRVGKHRQGRARSDSACRKLGRAVRRRLRRESQAAGEDQEHRRQTLRQSGLRDLPGFPRSHRAPRPDPLASTPAPQANPRCASPARSPGRTAFRWPGATCCGSRSSGSSAASAARRSRSSSTPRAR